MALPTFTTFTFEFTFPASPPSKALYILYLDGIPVTTPPGLFNPVTPAFTGVKVKGFPGSIHVAEVKVVDLNVNGYDSQYRYGNNAQLVSDAAKIKFEIPEKNPVGGTGNSLANAIIKYILESVDYIEKAAAYTCNILTVSDAYQFLVKTFSSYGGTTQSANFIPSGTGYAPYNILASADPLQFSDSYPLGSQVHLEITPLNIGNIQIGPIQVIDLQAGQPDAPNPVVVSIPTAAILANIQANAGSPPVANNIQFVCESGLSATLPALVFGFNTGTDVVQQAVPLGGFLPDDTFTIISGPVFDYLYPILIATPGIVSYIVLDPTGTIVQQVGVTDF